MAGNAVMLKIARSTRFNLARLYWATAGTSYNFNCKQKNLMEIPKFPYQFYNTYSTDTIGAAPDKTLSTQQFKEGTLPPTIPSTSDIIVEEKQTHDPLTISKSPQPDKLYKKIELEILGYEPRVLDSYQWFVLTAAKHLNIEVGKVWAPFRSDKYRFNLLASVHIFKKHQVHYEVRTYHRFINIHKLTGSTADTFLEYIQRNLPEGIGMKVTKVEVLPKPNFLDKDNDKPE